jgi:hypothetical protein
MDPNKILVMRSNANPFYVTKFPWTDLVDKATIRSVNIYDYAPDWARQKNAELEQRIDSDTPKVSPYGGTSKNNSKEDQSNDQTNKNPQSNVPGNKKGGENMNEVDQRNPKPTSNADEESQKVLGEF